MQLENMVSEVKKVGKNGIIVEFNNGYAVAYEKKTLPLQEQEFQHVRQNIKMLIPDSAKSPIAYRRIGPYGNWKLSYSDIPSANLSHEMDCAIGAYAAKLQERERISVHELYREFTESLGIKSQHKIDWKHVGSLLPFVLGWPIVPFLYTLHAAQTGQNRYAAFSFFSPLLFFHLLLKPEKSYKITKTDVITSKPNDTSVALSFGYDASTAGPKRFQELNIYFPDGSVLFENSAFYHNDDFHKKKYRTAKYFLKTDECLIAKFYEHIREEESKKDELCNLEQTTTKEEHIALLRRIEFIGG